MHPFSRRYFFYGSLLAGAAHSGGFGSTPGLTALGYKSFNERLNIALIGMDLRGPQIVVGAAASENIRRRAYGCPGLPQGGQVQRFSQDDR